MGFAGAMPAVPLASSRSPAVPGRNRSTAEFLAVAVEAVRAAGGEVTLLDLNDYVLPRFYVTATSRTRTACRRMP